MKVLVLGAGNMGLTYAEGMANSPFLNKRKLMIFDVSPQKTEALSTMAQFDAYDSIEECVPQADVIFIAVKPYHSQSLFDSIKPYINQDQLFVSLMAGVTINTIQEGLGVKKVIRTIRHTDSSYNI